MFHKNKKNNSYSKCVILSFTHPFPIQMSFTEARSPFLQCKLGANSGLLLVNIQTVLELVCFSTAWRASMKQHCHVNVYDVSVNVSAYSAAVLAPSTTTAMVDYIMSCDDLTLRKGIYS